MLRGVSWLDTCKISCLLEIPKIPISFTTKMFGFQNQRVTNLRMNKHKTGVIRQLPVLGAHVHSETSRAPRIVHLEKEHHYKPYTPEMYCNMEPKNGGLEADFPFQFRWFLGSMLIFRGCKFRGSHGSSMFVFCFVYDFIFEKKSLRETRSAGFVCFGLGVFSGHIYLSKNALFYPSKDPPAIKHLHPGRLTWNPFRRKMIFQTSKSMFHVNLPGCSNPIIDLKQMSSKEKKYHLSGKMVPVMGRASLIPYGCCIHMHCGHVPTIGDSDHVDDPKKHLSNIHHRFLEKWKNHPSNFQKCLFGSFS